VKPKSTVYLPLILYHLKFKFVNWNNYKLFLLNKIYAFRTVLAALKMMWRPVVATNMKQLLNGSVSANTTAFYNIINPNHYFIAITKATACG
jgi:hypothetical protein